MRRWLTVCLLGAGLIIAYVDRTNLSVALASADFQHYFSLTDEQRGLLNSAFFWTYTLLQIPAGLVLDRFGVKRPLVFAFLFWCAVSAATSAANLLWQLILLRLLLGVGESVVFPAGLSWIHRNINEERRGLAAAIFVGGSKWGPALAAPLSAWLITQYGWRSMFRVLGLGGLLWLDPWILLGNEGDTPPRRRAAAPEWPLGAIFRSRIVWGTLIGTFCYNYFLFFSITWLPAYFVERRHLSLTSMGIYTMISFAGTGIVAIVAGAAADWMIARGADAAATRRWFTIAGLLAASTELIGALAQSNQVAVFFALFSMAGLGLATANYWALTQTLIPKVAAGRIAGVQNTALNLAGIVAPVLTGWLKQVTGSYNAPMQAIWVTLLIGVGAYLWLVRAQPQGAGAIAPAEDAAISS
ncbi:MAG TPA: MFS transporter [Bryobacteraceae bacterium]|nr:MFS transporter [Bryobacteraceae bacterium]